MKQSELASLLDVHPTYVTRWETDRVTPRGKALTRLAKVLEVPLEELQSIAEQAHNRSSFSHLSDKRLAELLSQVHRLDERDQEALKRILETMLTRLDLEAVLNRAS